MERLRPSFLFFLLLFFLSPFSRQGKAGWTPLSASVYQVAGQDEVMEGYQALAGKNYSLALEFFNKGLAAELSSGAPDPERLQFIYSSLGICHKNLWRYAEARKAFDQALELAFLNEGRSSKNVAALYNNTGLLYSANGDFDRALGYFENALNVYREIIPSDPAAESRVLNNMGMCCRQMGKLSEALQYLRLSIEKRRQAGISQLHAPYHNLANTLRDMGNYGEAAGYYRLALENALAARIQDDTELVRIYISYGLFLADNTGDIPGGKEVYLEALSLAREKLGERHILTAQLWINLAGISSMENNYPVALEQYQKAIVALSDGFYESGYQANPSLEQVSYLPGFLSALRRKAQVLSLLYDSTADTSLLQASLQCYELAAEGFEWLRGQYQTEESKLFLTENVQETYHQAVLTALKYHKVTGSTGQVEKAFEFAERSKASVLLSTLRNIEALETGGIPEEIRRSELEMKREMARLQELVYEELKSARPDTGMVSRHKQAILSLGRKQDSLVDMLERDYPSYHALKYRTSVPPVKEIRRKLKKKETMVEYVAGENELVIFCLTRKGIQYHIQPLDERFDEHFNRINTFLTAKNFDHDAAGEFRRFTVSSEALYEYLLGPFSGEIRGKHLIVIPDGKLHFLPFEILLCPRAGEEYTNYLSLPYLFRYQPVSYVNSASMLRKGHRNQRQLFNRLVAYAPVYEQSGTDPSLTAGTRQQYRDRLLPIPGALEEVNRIGRRFRGDIVTGMEATEEHFKRNAGTYDIIHLAMHTVIDNENPLFSKLAFSHTGGKEDGLLNTFEIYNLNLKARMTTLSSCNSGIGQLRKGEGLISLARGFIYAGCPGLVLSLWEVEDLSSADLMESFYRELRKGYSKDRALQTAKKEFLLGSDPLRTHPYFWSGYLVIGNPGPVFYNRILVPGVSAAAVLILLSLLWMGKRIRTRQNGGHS